MGSSCSNFKNNEIGNSFIGIKLLNWTASNLQLSKYHWWPMRESINPYYNNLYCDNGGLDKYDRLFGTASKQFQKQNYFRKSDSNESDAEWAGFCDKATILSCLYEYPLHSVRVNYNRHIIQFNPRDIEMLMIVACDDTVKKNMSIFLGERNNSNSIEEPYPSDLLHILKMMCYMDEPFAMDIDNGTSVWNYAYDKVQITMHNDCPLPYTPLKNGKTIYLNFIIDSSGYPGQKQCLWGYIYTPTIESNIEYVKEGWISKKHPDFIWKKFAKDTIWEGKCTLNPEINANHVYKIYKHSLRKHNTILEINS